MGIFFRDLYVYDMFMNSKEPAQGISVFVASRSGLRSGANSQNARHPSF
jgi:hypothetical protein